MRRQLRENETRAKDIKRGGSAIYIWATCPECNKQRWVTIHSYKHSGGLCKSCAAKHSPKARGAGHPKWKGGRAKQKGYIAILLRPDNFFYPMAGRSVYVFEHRLVMAKHLGRCLQSWEWVHHKNGIKDDNRIENLELTTSGSHTLQHNKGYKDGFHKGYQDGKQEALKTLEEELNKEG